MEAYALKEVCQHLKVEFLCYKYVSDQANNGAGSQWKQNLAKGSELFQKELVSKFGKSKLI